MRAQSTGARRRCMMSDVGLDPGERLIWVGTPHVLRYAVAKGRPNVLHGIVIVGFVLVFMYVATNKSYNASASDFFKLISALILINAVIMLLSPVWHFVRGLRASYALTDRRAILDFPTERISVPLAQIQYVDVRRFAGGKGDIYFKDTYDSESIQRNGFVAIDDVGKVEQMLRDAIGRAMPSEPTS